MHDLASSYRLTPRSTWGRGSHASKLRGREDIHPVSALAVVLTLCGAVLWTSQAQASSPTISVAEDADHNVVLTVKGDRAPTFQIYEARQKPGARPRFVVELPGTELDGSAPIKLAPAVVYERGSTYAKRARSAPRVELSFFSSVDYDASTNGNALIVKFVPLDDKETLLAAHQRRVEDAKRVALAQKQSAEERKRAEALEKQRAKEERIRLAALEKKRKEAAAREAERLLREQQAREEAARLAAVEKKRKEAERLAKLEEERKRKEAERVARLEAEKKAKLEAERKRKEEAERLAKLEAERKRIVAERKEAERLAKLEAERKRKEEAERLAKLEAERKRKEAERLAKLEEERKRKEAERLAKLEAERKRIEAERKEAERLAKLEAERKRKEAERLAKLEEERKRIEAERKEAERLAKLEEERKRKEAERLAKLEAERKRIEAERKEAERLAKLEEERKRKEAERLAQIEAERKRQQAERRRLEEERERARLAELQRKKERERLAAQRRRQAQEIEARRAQGSANRRIEVASANRQGFGFGGTKAVDIGGRRGLYRLADAPRVRQDAFGGGGDDGDGPRGVLSRVTVRREARDKSAVGIRVDGGARYSVSRRSSNELVLTLFDTEAQSLTVRRILDARDLRTSILRVLPHVEEDVRHRVELVIELRGSGAARVTEEDEMLWLHVES